MIRNHRSGRARFREFHPAIKALVIIAGIAFLGGIFILMGFVVSWLWNWLMPVLFRLPTIGFWQAWGLLLLTTILFNRPHSVGEASRERRRKRDLRDRLREANEHDEGAAPQSPTEVG